MPGWEPLAGLIRLEETQLIEEGVDAGAAKAAAAEAELRLKRNLAEAEVWAPFAGLPRRKDFGFDEPSDLPGIQNLREPAPKLAAVTASDDTLLDQMHGAWLGRCAGCALGKPVEGFMGNRGDLLSW